MRDFLAKCWIFEEKMGDLPFNGGFSKRNHLIFAEMKDLRRGSAGFSLKWGIPEEKTRDFCLNGGFPKRKHVIFGLKGGF